MNSPRSALRRYLSFSFAGKILHLWLLVSLPMVFWSGCDLIDTDPSPSLPGLATIKLKLTAEAQQTLNANRNLNVFVPADLVYDYPEKGIRERHSVEIRNAGQFSRRYFKHSYRLRMPAGRPFRGKTILNLSSQPTDDTKLRSVLGYTVLRAAGFEVPELEPVAVYINDRYQGLHYLIEPIDRSFFDRRHIPITALFEARMLEARWSYSNGFNLRLGYAKVFPEDENFSELDRLIRRITDSTPENIEQNLASIFDLQSYINYTAAQVVIQNFDSWNNNFHLYHDDGLNVMRLQPWDVDHAYDSEVAIHPSTALNDLIAANLTLRQRYLSRLLELLDGPANPPSLISIVWAEAPRLAEAYDRDPYYRSAGKTMVEQALELENQIVASHGRLRAEVVRLLAELP